MSITISIFALWRDSEKHIARTLAQLDELIKLEGFNFRFHFYSNDNKDNTHQILTNWCAANNGAAITETLNAPRFGSVASNVRTAMLAYYRNKNKSMVGGDDKSQYSFVFDSDLIWGNQDFLALYRTITDRNNIGKVMVGANSRQNIKDLTFGLSQDSFYDVFPLQDSWGQPGMYFTDSPFYDEIDHENFLKGKPIKVNSGFGGMALINTEAFQKVRWSSDFTSEHVHFCHKLREYGHIYITPNSRPRAEIDLSTLNMENCKKIAAQQFNNYRMGAQLKRWSMSDTFQFNLK